MKYPVLIPNIFDHPFTYESSLKLNQGDYVNVPFGKKTITGVIWDQFESNIKKKFEIKTIKKKLNVEPLIVNPREWELLTQNNPLEYLEDEDV